MSAYIDFKDVNPQALHDQVLALRCLCKTLSSWKYRLSACNWVACAQPRQELKQKRRLETQTPRFWWQPLPAKDQRSCWRAWSWATCWRSTRQAWSRSMKLPRPTKMYWRQSLDKLLLEMWQKTTRMSQKSHQLCNGGSKHQDHEPDKSIRLSNINHTSMGAKVARSEQSEMIPLLPGPDGFVVAKCGTDSLTTLVESKSQPSDRLLMADHLVSPAGSSTYPLGEELQIMELWADEPREDQVQDLLPHALSKQPSDT